MSDQPGPHDLRALIMLITYEPNELGDDPKRVEGFAHADAWEADLREKHELACMHANEYGNLRIANANAQVAKAQADNAAMREKLEALERAFETQQFLIGTIEDERDALREKLVLAEAHKSGLEDMAQDDWYRSPPESET